MVNKLLVNDESLSELEKILYRVSKTLLNHYYVILGMIYVGWALWASFIFLVMIIIEATGVSYYIFYAIMIPTWFIALFFNNKKLPEIVKGAISLSGKNTELEEFVKKANRVGSLFWILGVLLYIAMTTLLPLINESFTTTAAASGLIILLATGNMGVFYPLKKYAGMTIKEPIIVISGMYLSALLLFVFDGPRSFVWSYAINVLLIAYLLLALYCFILSVK